MNKPIALDKYFPFLLRSISSRIAVGTSSITVGNYRIGMREWRILAFIADRGAPTNKDISDDSGADKASISRGLNRLLELELIQQSTDPDGSWRTKPYRLSAAGKKVYSAIAPGKLERMEMLWANLTKAEKKELIRLLNKLKTNVDQVLGVQD